MVNDLLGATDSGAVAPGADDGFDPLLRLATRGSAARGSWIRIGADLYLYWTSAPLPGWPERLGSIHGLSVSPTGPEVLRGRRADEGCALVMEAQFGAEIGSVGLIFADPELSDPAIGEAASDLAQLAAVARRLASEKAERKRVGDSLRVLHRAVENMQLGVTITDSEGRILYTNPADAAMHGYRPEELVGEHARIFGVPETHQTDPKPHRPVRSWTREGWNLHRDGTRFPVLLWSDAVHGAEGERLAVVTCCENLSGRREAEEALRRSENKFRAIFENAAIGIALVGQDGWIMRSNPALAAMLGTDENTLGGTTLGAFSELEESGKLENVLERLYAPGVGSTQAEHRFVRADGRVIRTQVTASVIPDAEGRPICWIMLIEDVTQRRLLEEQVQFAQKMEAVGQLAGGVAHDFNNLLTAIKGNADLLLSECDPSQSMWRDLDEIRDAAVRATTLIRQLLAVSRRQDLQPEVFDPNRIVVEMQRILRRLIGDHITTEIDLADDVGAVRADPAKMEQVLLNLAINARDAMPDGGTLRIRTGATQVAPEDPVHSLYQVVPGPYAVLAVSDTGHGMDPKVLSRIFEPFFSTKPRDRGTGLGLSTVYGIVRQSGGYIWAESVLRQGSTFYVYLPQVLLAEAEPTDAPTPRVRDEVILLVNPHAEARTLEARLLDAHGYRVLEAADQSEAQRVGETYGDRIHLLVVAALNPPRSARDLVEGLRPIRRDMRVLFTSKDGTMVRRTLLLPQDVATVLPSPYAPESFLQAVREVLDGLAPSAVS